ncbi:MAG: hypothetical protein ACXAC5_03790 [Promethearchaeota archaeon]|jgi:hypothetical protein
MTRKQAIEELIKTRKLNTAMLKPLNISFESFLQFAQLSDLAAEKITDKLIDKLCKEVE